MAGGRPQSSAFPFDGIRNTSKFLMETDLAPPFTLPFPNGTEAFGKLFRRVFATLRTGFLKPSLSFSRGVQNRRHTELKLV